MDGGIREWQGMVADGPPEGGVAYFETGTDAADMAALAWALEENTRLFYTRLAGMRPDTKEAELFLKLVSAEEHHKATLAAIHKTLNSDPIARFYQDQASPILEGGIDLDEALAWAEDKTASEILVALMSLEANAYDRYLKMADISEDEASQDVFRTIAREEKGHLGKLSELLDHEVERAK